MAEWTTWMNERIFRMDLVPGVYLTLIDRTGSTEWVTGIDAKFQNADIQKSVTITATAEELDGPYEHLLASMEARALKLWETYLSDVSELSMAALKVLDSAHVGTVALQPDEERQDRVGPRLRIRL